MKRRWKEYSWKARGIQFTIEQYDAMLAAQGGKCAICGRPPKTRALAVDHDHKTKAVRGLLCDWCNRRLLIPRATVTMLRAAADYLERHAQT